MLELLAFALIGLFATVVALGHYFLFTAVVYGTDGMSARRARKAARPARRMRVAAAR
jgi:putative flippase GtrA